jgi:hypothetical protein
VQLDRVKTRSRKENLESLLKGFQFTLAVSMSLVEFKATIIRECITIHNQMRARNARYTSVRDALLEKDYPQLSLRAHIFNNLLQVFAQSSFEISEADDRRLAEKARLSLENVIPRLYEWFVHESCGAILTAPLHCDRAGEPPTKKTAAFETNLPICRRGKNKTCQVEVILRTQGPKLMERLGAGLATSDQFQRAAEVIKRAIAEPKCDLSHGDCRRVGDCLIAIEAGDNATHVVSSNAKEWRPLADAMGYTFVHTTFPDERTK